MLPFRNYKTICLYNEKFGVFLADWQYYQWSISDYRVTKYRFQAGNSLFFSPNTLVLSVVLYGCGSWSLTLREVIWKQDLGVNIWAQNGWE